MENKAISCDAKIDEKPDFVRILERLRQESSFAQDNAECLTSLVSSIKPMQASPVEPEAKSNPPACLVEYLWDEIYRIQDSNRKTTNAIKHLHITIGN